METVKHIASEDVTIKTEPPWLTSPDCSVKKEDSAQDPDITSNTFTTPIKEENDNSASSYNITEIIGDSHAQPHSSATADSMYKAPMTQPDSGANCHTQPHISAETDCKFDEVAT